MTVRAPWHNARPATRAKSACVSLGRVGGRSPCRPLYAGDTASAGHLRETICGRLELDIFPQGGQEYPVSVHGFLSARRRLGQSAVPTHARQGTAPPAPAPRKPGPNHVGGWNTAFHMHLDDSVYLFRESLYIGLVVSERPRGPGSLGALVSWQPGGLASRLILFLPRP